VARDDGQRRLVGVEAAAADAQSLGALCEGSAAESKNLEALPATQESRGRETSLRLRGGVTVACIHYGRVLDGFLDAQAQCSRNGRYQTQIWGIQVHLGLRAW
jgi:hypothetical protein